MRLRAAAATDPGPRPSNQDAHYVNLELGLFVVADGMGGHNAGDVASRMAVETVVEFITTTHGRDDMTWPYPIDLARSMEINRLAVALQLANQKVREAGLRDPSRAGMGTTIVAALVTDGRIAIGHVGDSRAYLVRDHTMQQVTEDHTWVNTVLRADAAAIHDHPMRHVLTSSIGMGADLSPSLAERPLAPGERYLICTDGIHGYLDDEALGRVMRAPSPEAAAGDAVREALAAGTTDNATAVVLNVD